MPSKPKTANAQNHILLGTEETYIKDFDLIEVQKGSWKTFLENDLKEIISEFFPIEDYTGKKLTLHFNDLSFGEPRYDLALCKSKKLTFDQPIYLNLTIENKKNGENK